MARRRASISAVSAQFDSNWQAENDLRTYQEWCVIKKDKARLNAVKELAKKKLLELTPIVGESEEGEED